ncbi:MAG: GNAT family N-acetyltransferase [Spirochaetes bacterium]|nr:GNAT family N-acetyltransferase [Spirochaetota bacterium]
MTIDKYSIKIKRNINDYGIKTTIKKILSRLFGIIYEKRIYRIYIKKLKNPPILKTTSLEPNFKLKEIKENDIDHIKQIEKNSEWFKGQLRSKFKKGAYCLSVIDRNKIIGFNLINFGKTHIPLINYTKTLNKDSAWSEHIAVEKEYRRSGIATVLRQNIFKELSKKGIKWLYGGCLIDNYPSLSLARKLGFKEIVDIEYIKFFGIKKWLFKRIKEK